MTSRRTARHRRKTARAKRLEAWRWYWMPVTFTRGDLFMQSRYITVPVMTYPGKLIVEGTADE